MEKREGVYKVKVAIPAKFSEKSDLFPAFGQKNTLFSSHTMSFNMKFQPVNMQSDYCHKVLSDLKLSNKLEYWNFL